ncbi:MAG: hypothetical protein H0X02_09765 [Nitrosomonas sp.]|jgi:hypothetical protein|nr:hypothetical protein [Nitrosomonas sp.]
MTRPLGRKEPTDFKHVQKYPFMSAAPTQPVERILPLPYWHWEHDQGSEGACVGFAESMMMAIRNELQARETGTRPYSHRYDALWLYHEAQKIDEWAGEDYDGTSVRAGLDVLRTRGHRRIINGSTQPEDNTYGITANRWATSVDDIRAAIAQGIPVAIGVNWYSNFDKPQKLAMDSYHHWIATVGQGNWGNIRGGHAVCIYGASDRKQAFLIKNSWGSSYPLTHLPYYAMEILLKELGEASLITDR